MSSEVSDEIIGSDLELSEHTLNALKEFYAETSGRLNAADGNTTDEHIDENWQLSQFWYTEDTARYLCDEVLHALSPTTDEDGEPSATKSIVCISCPTLFDAVYKQLAKDGNQSIEPILFEFDRRFEAKYPSSYVFYDYNEPMDDSLKDRFKEGSVDVVIADPPFLSEECLRKTSQTIKYLAKDKVLVCTGAVMRDVIADCLQLDECLHFEPKHNRHLGNQFRCFANFRLRQSHDQ